MLTGALRILAAIVLAGALVTPSQAGEAEDLREVWVTVDATTGVAGYVLPGDRIDIVLLRTKEGELVDRVIIEDIMVLGAKTLGQYDVSVRLTVEVNDRQSKKLAAAKEIGVLSVDLRELTDGPCRDGDVIYPVIRSDCY